MRNRVVIIAAFGLILAVSAMAAGEAAVAAPAGAASLSERAGAPSVLSFDLIRRGLVRPSPAGPVLAQRAIEAPADGEEPEKPEESEEPEEPVAPAELGLEELETPPRSSKRAMLLSAAAPGAGELYLGSNRGFLFMGVEAVAWITFFSFRESAGNVEEEMFDFAGRESGPAGHFSRAVFRENCVGQQGLSCVDAAQMIDDFWENDRAEYYEIISKFSIYKAGWGAVQFENSQEPEQGTEEHRAWIADLARAQDRDFIRYNELRDERNDKSRTSRSMGVVILLNHLASAWHAYALGGGLRVGDATEVEFQPALSFNDLGGKVVLKHTF